MARLPLLLVLLAACGPNTPSPVDPTPTPIPAPDAAVGGAPPIDAAPVDPGYTGLGASSVSADTIAKYAAAPLDAAISGHIQAMLDVRGAFGGALTSDGKRMIFNWKITGTNQVWRQDGPNAWPIQLTGGEDNTSFVGVAPDDSFVVVSRDHGGAENPGLYLLDPDGGALTEIFHQDGVQAALGFIADDSKTVYYRANDVDPASYAIYRWDVATHAREAVFTEPGLWSVLDHDGDRVLLANNLGNTHTEIDEYDLGTKVLTPRLGQGEALLYDARFGAKPGTLVVLTNHGDEFQRVFEWKAGALTALTPAMAHDVSELGIDQARKRLYYSVNDDGYTRSYALDATTHKALKLPKLPDADNVTFTGLARDGRRVQLSYDGATRPTTTVVYDWKTGKLATWRSPSTPEIDVSKFTRATLESYPARDGTAIPMFVWRVDPARCTGPCPVVVEFHGGPEGQSQPGFSVWAQLFVDAGFTFVQPNVRGSDGYGKTWLDADNAAKRLDVITDLEDCATAMRTTFGKDGVAPKVGVTGGSYGGYATLMAMTYFAGAYDAGVEEVGISNLVTFLENTAPYRRILRTSEYGDPDHDRDALVKLSPITYVDRVKAPLLLIQGVNDPRVPVGEALQIHDALTARRVPSELILFPDEGHGASKRANQVLAIGHTLAFFQDHLR